MAITRRQILAAGLAWPLRGASRIGRSRISAITDEIGRTPMQAIEFARQYRLQWVELRGVPGAKKSYSGLPETELKQAAKELADNGLRVSFLNTGLLKHMLPGTEPANPRHRQEDAEARFQRHLDELRHAILAAHILKTDKVRVFAFHRVREPESLLPRIAEIVGGMAEIAAREKVRLLVENEGSCNVATCAELAALMKLLPSPAVGINWDPLNGVRFGEPPFPDGYALLPKHRIGNVQIKGRSILSGPQRLDWTAIFDALDRDGYEGQYGLETHIFGEGQIQASHDSMKEILRIVEPS